MHTKKILLTGASGFVGSSLASYLANLGHSVTGIDINITDAHSIVACDVSNTHQLAAILNRIQPEVIIHCAARKNLPDCEENKAATFASNSLSTETIAIHALTTGAKIIYLSSDVVFDGVHGNYHPDDTPRPINWYGKTKAFSEIILRAVDNVAICRTALVIGSLNQAYKANLEVELENEILVNQTLLPQYIYQRLRKGQTVRLPSSIVSNPTPVTLLCEIIGRIIDHDARGIYHATGPDAVSRHEVGLIIAESFGLSKSLVIQDDNNISSLRPRNISMNSQGTFDKLGIDPQNWRLKDYFANEALYA